MSKSTLHIAYAAAGLTTTGLVQMLREVNGATTADQTARVQAIVTPLMNMMLSDGRKFLTEAVASTKTGPENKPDHVVKQRVSEARQIYGALKLIPGFTVDKMGWVTAVEAARKALAEKQINACGNRVLSKEEKLERSVKDASVELLAEVMSSDADDAAKVKMLSQVTEKAQEKLASSELLKHADRIIKRQGAVYASKLAVLIVDMLSSPVKQEEPAAQAATTKTK